MVCPNCGSNQRVCIDSRERKSSRIRRYKCLKCESRFSSCEIPEVTFRTFRSSLNAFKQVNIASGVILEFLKELGLE